MCRNMQLRIIVNAAAPECGRMLHEDTYTFSVLHRIIQGPCARTITDDERLLICHSAAPYPVWVWQPDDAAREELAGAWRVLRSEFPFEQGYRFNVKYQLAQYILEYTPEGKNMAIKMGLFAYSCENPRPPKKQAKGEFCAVNMEDFDIANQWAMAMQQEATLDQISEEETGEKTRALIEQKRLFFWKDENGENCSVCGVRRDGNNASIIRVYTPKEKRRMGYAANLVYGVTKAVRAQGMNALLYTDAGYTASNACYTQIGYEQRGSLCTIAAK